MKHYLLTGEKWIPVLRRDGSTADVSLLELFGEGRGIADLLVPPGARVALMRFLLCIVSRSLPLPPTRSEWEFAKERIAPQAIAYLKEWESAFDLYGEHPFLQVVGLEKEWNATLDKLDFNLASGNNHTLFDHLASDAGRPHPPAWQALMLLVAQNFSPDGLVGPNQWNHIKTNEKTRNSASPAVEGSPLHTFLLGDDILETLHLNLIPQAELGTLKLGVPVWEKFPNDPGEAQEFRDTLFGRLTPLSRAVRLPEEGTAISFAVACNYARISEFVDPYLENRRAGKKETLSYLRIQPERHPWRELESLLALHPSSAELTPPKHLQNRYLISDDKALRLWCGGVAKDQAKYIFSGEWLFTFQAQAQYRTELPVLLGHFARTAEEVATLLEKTIEIFWNHFAYVGDKNKPVNVPKKIRKEQEKAREQAQKQAVRSFWQRLDMSVAAFFNPQGKKEPDFTELYRELRDAAETFFTAALPNQSPRGIMAYVKTMPYFRKELKHILGDQITEKGDREDGE